MLHGDVLGERARLTPGTVALVDVATGCRYSYAELDARATRAARWLREGLGLARGDRFGLLAHNRVEYLDLFFAAAKCGCVIVPLGTRLTAHELALIVGDSGMRVLVYAGAFAQTVTALRALVAVGRAPALDAPADANDADYAAGLAAVPDDPAWTRERCSGDDLYALLYTSGALQIAGFSALLAALVTARDVRPPSPRVGGGPLLLVTPLLAPGSLGLEVGVQRW